MVSWRFGRTGHSHRRRGGRLLERLDQSPRNPARSSHACSLANDFWTAPLLLLGVVSTEARFGFTGRRCQYFACSTRSDRLGSHLPASLLVITANDGDRLASDLPDYPTWPVMLGWWVGGETFSLWSLLGPFVLTGVWMIFRRAKEPKHIELLAAVPDRG